ncbi:MAG: hypothetical protein E6H78_04685 [Betaproteobacteria bacterium]|nr:MAG: hypothetical protein E6H78_04685 [Betaproteobacteria bacterium]
MTKLLRNPRHPAIRKVHDTTGARHLAHSHLATVVGGLVEVPVMLSVVAIVNRSRRWYTANGAPA